MTERERAVLEKGWRAALEAAARLVEERVGIYDPMYETMAQAIRRLKLPDKEDSE